MARSILFIVDYYPPHIGGAEVVYQKVAEHLGHSGWKVSVLTTNDPNRKPVESMNGVTVYGVCRSRYLFTFLGLWKGWRLAKQCDLIQAATYSAGIVGWALGFLRSKPVYLMVHEVIGPLWFRLMNPVSAFFYWFFEWRLLAIRRFKKWIVFSEFVRLQLIKKGIQKDQIVTIPHGVDAGLFSPQNTDPALRKRLGYTKEDYLLLFFGRAGILKGGKTLIRAMESAPPKTKLLMLLSDHPRGAYCDLKKTAAENPNIQILDPVPRDRLPHYLNTADAVVVPSLQEGFGFAAAEACACGRPLVVSRGGALPEVVSGRVIFVEPGDVDAMANALQKAARGEWERIPKKRFLWKDALLYYKRIYHTAKEVGKL